jgi:2-keto-3-deoxy-6-phosphogluconate aldolase
VSSAAAGRVTFVQRADALASAATAAGADLVLVDLARPGVVDAVAAVATLEPRPVIVGFGSHVDRDTLAAATGAGADRVLARSAFFGDIVGALA